MSPETKISWIVSSSPLETIAAACAMLIKQVGGAFTCKTDADVLQGAL